MRMRRAVVTVIGAALLVGLAPAVAAMPAQAAVVVAPSAPKGLTVERDPGNLHDLGIRWKPVAGVSHYMVRVNDGARDTNYVAPASATTLVHHGQGNCTQYRVRISAVAADGTQSNTADTTVASLAPGGVTGVNGNRTEAGSAAWVAWSAPRNPGYAPVTQYNVVFNRLTDGAVVGKASSLDTLQRITAINPSLIYTAKITALNSFGACVTSRFVVGSNRPTSPDFTVLRDTVQPASAVVSWSLPRWQGYGPVTSYAIGYKTVLDKSFTWVNAPAAARTMTIPNLDPTRDWQFVIRAYSSNDIGLLSRVVVLYRSGYTPINASVAVTSDASSIRVDFSSPVGSTTNYPTAVVDVARANGTVGWEDTHTVTNGAGQVVFLPVPCGVWTVTVSGVGSARTQQMTKTNVRVCDPAPVCFVSTLQNGGFEAPVIPQRNWRLIPATTTGLGWRNTAEGVVELWSTGYGGVPSAEGSQHAELNANVAGTLYQDLPTTPGTTMRWHLKHRGRRGVETMRVMIGDPNGTLQQSGPDISTGTAAWVQHTGTYTIPAGQTVTRFAFRAVNAGSYGNFLDDVVFTPEACQ